MEIIEPHSQESTNDSNVDKKILKIAKKRVAFKKHFMVYLIVIGFMWLVWLLSGGGYPWPVWAMAGWGIALAFQYVGTYKRGELFSVEEEIKQIHKEISDQP